MPENILQKIINNRIKEIEKQKTLLSSETLQDQIKQNEIEDMNGIKYYNFKKKIYDNVKYPSPIWNRKHSLSEQRSCIYPINNWHTKLLTEWFGQMCHPCAT